MLPASDLQYVADKSDRVRDALAGTAEILITGANGFAGSWLLNAAEWMGFRVRAHRGRRAGDGDIREAVIPRGTTHVIHCANATTGAENASDTDGVCIAIAEGTKHVVQECDRVKAKLLLVSSGSVYQPWATRAAYGLAEDHPRVGGPGETVASKIAWAKRNAENYALRYNPRGGVVVARGFAWYGPRCPEHLLIAHMMTHALAGRTGRTEPLEIRDGNAVRSYTHIADVTRFLWHLLAFGKSGEAYNVGGQHVMTLSALSAHFAGLGSGAHFAANCYGEGGVPFCPDRTKFKACVGDANADELPFAEGLNRWYAWECGR